MYNPKFFSTCLHPSQKQYNSSRNVSWFNNHLHSADLSLGTWDRFYQKLWCFLTYISKSRKILQILHVKEIGKLEILCLCWNVNEKWIRKIFSYQQDLMNCQVIFFCKSTYFLAVFNPLFSKQLTKVCFLKEWLNASGEKVKFTKSICEREKKKKQGNFSLGKIWNFQLSKCYSLILFISNSV